MEEPREILDRLCAVGVVEAPRGDATALLCKPYVVRVPLKDWAGIQLGSRLIAYADLVLIQKPRYVQTGGKLQRWSDPVQVPPWTHTIMKCRYGSMIWDGLDAAGYETGFHHVKIGESFEDRVFLSERTLRALKVFVQ